MRARGLLRIRLRMRVLCVWALLFALLATSHAQSTQSTRGIRELVKRRLPRFADDFEFALVNATDSSSEFDRYTVTTTTRTVEREGSGNETETAAVVRIEGNTISALASGLRRYLKDAAHVDLFWFVESGMDRLRALPSLDAPLEGASTVEWRYHFNTVTFSYTTAFWDFAAWESQLDWMSLHGINLPLAWVGSEYVLLQTFLAHNLSLAQTLPFFSGPAFQAWNRMGNIHGSWSPDNTSLLPLPWITAQFELQKKIVARMVELGMTPVLPAFSGFVPTRLTEVYPAANVVNGSSWEDFPEAYTETSFLDPTDPLFAALQKTYVSLQQTYYGNVSHIYAIDQYNENTPVSDSASYLRSISAHTLASLKAADPAAVWLMQGWLFFSSRAFWSSDRISAFLSGVENDGDMLILDLFSESAPQWERTRAYEGKPWIWCMLHNYGGNMGLYGQVMNVTTNSVAARRENGNMVGYGLTMEGMQGNEVVYDLLLDQAWSEEPVDTAAYFQEWVKARYGPDGGIEDEDEGEGEGGDGLPEGVYAAWDLLRTSAYNNTNLTSNAVPKGIFELRPNVTGLTGRTGHHPTTVNYDPAVVVYAWRLLYTAAGEDEGRLWEVDAFRYDLVDVTRQVLSNAFIPVYLEFVDAYNSGGSAGSGTNASAESQMLAAKGEKLLQLLYSLDDVLSTNEHFSLGPWIESARAWASSNNSNNANSSNYEADYYEYNARNQITLWGPDGEISDYGSKSWGGLVRAYYVPRWRIFVDHLVWAKADGVAYDEGELGAELGTFEMAWQVEKWEEEGDAEVGGELRDVLERVSGTWAGVFGG